MTVSFQIKVNVSDFEGPTLILKAQKMDLGVNGFSGVIDRLVNIQYVN